MNKPNDTTDWKAHWGLSGALGLAVDSVAATAYTLPEVLAAEREAIFRKAWLLSARVEEVAEPGSFIRREIPPLATEALITRDRDGSLHAFHNACQHRGPAIVSECKGKTSAFTCPYHAWTYGLDGKLKGLPGKEYFPQAKVSETRLKPIHMEVWNGFIFLNFSDEPELTLAEFLGDFDARFDGLPLGEYPHMLEMTRDIDANWKALMEASNEGYHVTVTHRASLGGQMTGADNPYNNYYDPVFGGPHASATVQANLDWRPDHPVMQFVYASEAFRAQPGGAHEDVVAQAGPTPFTAHPAINRIGLPAMSAECMLIFPFTCLQFMPNRWIWFQYWPIDTQTTRFTMRLYSQSPPASWRDAFAEAHMLAYTRDIVTEDGVMVAMQQRGFASCGIERTMFGENEPVIRFFHQSLAAWLSGTQKAK